MWAVDFDGTLCTNWYPNIGPVKQEMIDALKFARQQGVKLILWTCREDELLQNALEFCRNLGLEFDAVNDNIMERKIKWGNNPRKIGADMYIDDKAFNSGGSLCELMDMLMQ